jgi:hypothetical protein
MFHAALSFLPPLAAAWLVVRWACPAPRTPFTTVLRLGLSLGLALGFTSATYFLWLLWRGPTASGFLAAELAFFGVSIVGLAWVTRRTRLATRVVAEDAARMVPRWPGVVLFLVSVTALATGAMQAWRSPHGDLDAWAIWNLRARFLYRGGEDWRDGFRPELTWAHPDYPLLLPANVARCWTFAGGETTLAPRLIALAFAAATAFVLVSGVALLRTPTQGCLAGIVLLATPAYVELATAQYADVPLGFYFLASVLLFEVYDRQEVKLMRVPLLAGLLTGMAAWTKNEGLLFLVATLAARGVAARGPWRVRAEELLAFAAGLTPFLACVAYFKWRLAPASDLLEEQSLPALWGKLTTLKRYGVVAVETLGGMLRLAYGAGALLPLYALLLGSAPVPRGGRHVAVVLGLMLLGYALVYLTTPHDLTWHVSSSADRLLLQLWPTALLLFFLRFAAPEERLSAVAV